VDVEPPAESGLKGSVGRLLDGLFGSVEDRLELLSIEVREEKLRLTRLLVWLFALFFAGSLAVAFASVAVIIAVWNTPARIPVAVGIASVYLALAAVAAVKLRTALKNGRRPFAASLEELRNDRRCLTPKS
jgi:uncharacterized membrane protein YqjE